MTTPAFATATRSTSLYSTSRWKEASRAFLIGKRCVDCGTTTNLQTDHEPAHRGNEQAFWDPSRFVARCRSCHAAKTGHEVAARRSPKREAEVHPGMMR